MSSAQAAGAKRKIKVEVTAVFPMFIIVLRMPLWFSKRARFQCVFTWRRYYALAALAESRNHFERLIRALAMPSNGRLARQGLTTAAR